MTTGSLIVAMVLHALWDFGTLGILATDRQQKPLAGMLALAIFAVAAVRGGRGRRRPPEHFGSVTQITMSRPDSGNAARPLRRCDL